MMQSYLFSPDWVSLETGSNDPVAVALTRSADDGAKIEFNAGSIFNSCSVKSNNGGSGRLLLKTVAGFLSSS
jgi:hypothetical protein